MRKLSQRSATVAIIGVSSLLAILIISLVSSPTIFQQSQSVTAEQPKLVSKKAIGPMNVLKIKSIEVTSKQSKDADIDLVVEEKNQGLGIDFKAVDKGTNDKEIPVDGWEVNLNGVVFDLARENFMIADQAITAKSSILLKEINLSNKLDLFAEYPGVYLASLHGYNNEDLLAYELADHSVVPEKERHELASYGIVAELTIGFAKKIVAISHRLPLLRCP